MLALFLVLIEEEGDKRKFQYIYLGYRYQMLYIANDILKDRHLAEDAVQNSFLYIAKHMEKLKGTDVAEAGGYIYLVTKHKSIDVYRKNKRDREIDRLLLLEYARYPTPEELAIQNQQVKRIVVEILRLPVLYKECLLLNVVYEYSPKEISKLLAISHSAAKQRVHRGKELLRRGLQNE